jgi:hypothetical protein
MITCCFLLRIKKKIYKQIKISEKERKNFISELKKINNIPLEKICK